MKIRAFEVRRFVVRGAAGREGGMLVLREEEGLEGVGEAAPIGGWSGGGETLEGVVCGLNAVCGRIGEIDVSAPALEGVERGLEGCGELLAGCPAAVFALETALLDLVGQRRGVDVASCLAGGARVGGVETSALLMGPVAGEGFVEEGVAALRRGFRTLKVKLRAEEDEALAREIEGLRALRQAAPEFELRLDPNGRWAVPDARRRLAMLAVLQPVFVEQPVPAGALAELGPCAVPWAADESLAVPAVVEKLSREGGCAAFVIKPAALGIGRALELARLARARGLQVVVTHFLDGPVGLAAACETALALAGSDGRTPGAGGDLAMSQGGEGEQALIACGLDPHAGLRALPPELLPHHREAGRIRPTGAAGLGLPHGQVLRALSAGAPTGMDPSCTGVPQTGMDATGAAGERR